MTPAEISERADFWQRLYATLRAGAQRLRSMRLARGWTQRRLARRAGLSLYMIRKLEREGFCNAKVCVLNNLSVAFDGEAICWLATGEGPRPRLRIAKRMIAPD